MIKYLTSLVMVTTSNALMYSTFYIAIIWVSGSDDYKDVELFNGETNLYLQAQKVGYGYKLKVADRPLVSCVYTCLIGVITTA